MTFLHGNDINHSDFYPIMIITIITIITTIIITIITMIQIIEPSLAVWRGSAQSFLPHLTRPPDVVISTFCCCCCFEHHPPVLRWVLVSSSTSPFLTMAMPFLFCAID